MARRVDLSAVKIKRCAKKYYGGYTPRAFPLGNPPYVMIYLNQDLTLSKAESNVDLCGRLSTP